MTDYGSSLRVGVIIFLLMSLFLLATLNTTMTTDISTTTIISTTESSDRTHSVPSKEWIAQQMEKAYRALNSSYTPPSNYTEVTQPQTYYCPNINVFLTAIPKNGCSNWKVAMLRAEGVLNEWAERHIARDAEWIHGGISHAYRMPQYRNSWNTTYDERIKSVQSVLVLRNPWVRAVSAYRQKLSSEHRKGGVLYGLQKWIVERMRGKGAWQSREDSPSFKEFIEYSIQVGGINDRHFRPQWKYLSYDLIRYDHVIPLELAAQMVGPLFAELDIDRNNLEGSYDHTSDPRNQSSVVKAREFLSSLSLELVEEFYKIYKIDFMLLNYSNFTDPNFPLPVGYY
eukprot:sb/3466433/